MQIIEQEKKKKYAHWFHPATMKLAEEMYSHDNCKSRSEFVEKAVQFYAGYVTEKDGSRFLSKTLVSTLRGLLTDTENRMATLLFKLTVEVAMMMHVLSSMANIDDEVLYRLRGRCVEDAKRTNGAISFAKVMRYQHRRE